MLDIWISGYSGCSGYLDICWISGYAKYLPNIMSYMPVIKISGYAGYLDMPDIQAIWISRICLICWISGYLDAGGRAAAARLPAVAACPPLTS